MPRYFPDNHIPSLQSKRRLAIISATLGPKDEELKSFFAGGAGSILSGALNAAGAMRSECMLGTVINRYEPMFFSMSQEAPEIRDGLTTLFQDLNEYNPNAILLLGEPALRLAGQTHPLHLFRGSVFNGFGGRWKCIATYAPWDLFRQWDAVPLFQFDVTRAVNQSEFPELRLPQRSLRTNLTPPEIISRLRAITPGTLVSFDIEGSVPSKDYPEGVSCIGISTDPSEGFIIPVQDYDDCTKLIVMKELAVVLQNPAIPKVLQNSPYDTVVLAWVWKMNTSNVRHDTMLSHWEIYPELPKSLALQTSIWTEEPYYKHEGKISDKQTHYQYCCKDACVTLEIHQAHQKALTDSQRKHYDFTISLLPSLRYMSLKGIRYDIEGAAAHLREVKAKMLEYQLVCDTLAKKKVNLNSPAQLVQVLYREFGFETQYAKKGGRKTNTPTADASALLTLALKYPHPFIRTLLAWKKLEGKRKQLELVTDADGRMRCSYNPVGTDTGRLSCQGSVTGSGTNMQTIMKSLRQFYIPDEGKYFFQCDLEGADGWTVAAHCARLGDTTMLDDYLAKIKPAKVLALMYLLGPHVSSMTRPEIKKLLKTTEIPAYLYDVCKVVQHGSNYMMRANMMAHNLLERSFKKSDEMNITYYPPRDCEVVQALYFKRYPGVQMWHNWVSEQLVKTRSLSAASGTTRLFFGRPEDRETIKAALSHEPQANTTYATNCAQLNLWRDPENRASDGSLLIEPLHSVHDALCGQFDIDRAEWAAGKIAEYFRNPLTIADMEIIIPFEGGYGKSWYHTDESNRIGVI